MSNATSPRDYDRAKDEALERALSQIEDLEKQRQEMGDALWNVMGHIDTPIGRRKLRLEHDTEWLADARKVLEGYKSEQQMLEATMEWPH